VTIDAKGGEIKFENGDIDGGKRLLREILSAMAAPGFKFSQVESVTDRENFLKTFLPSSVKKKLDPPSASMMRPSAPIAVSSKSARTATRKADTAMRSTLAPKSGARTFTVNGVRLASIYRECRDIKVNGSQNAASLLLRVFIELSSEALLTEKSVPIPAKAIAKGKTKWDDFSITLSDKILSVLSFLDTTGKDKQFQQARVALDQNSNSVFSITTLHGFFHNRDLIPTAVAIKEAWDAWESYLRALHAAR
jgi:hypothetical protein